MANNIYPFKFEDAKKYNYRFWKNKPTMKFDESHFDSHIIENLTDRKIYSSSEPLKILSSLSWSVVDSTDDTCLQKFVDFLNNNYKVGKKYKLNYTNSYIRWMIGSHKINSPTHLILTLTENNTYEIVGGIIVCMKNITNFNITDDFASVPILCVHSKYRLRKMSTVLIDEAIRRFTQLTNCNKGFFYSPICIPSPVAYVSYYHRPLNFKLLNNIGILNVIGDEETKKYEKLFNPSIKSNPDQNYLPMGEKYLNETYDLYNIWCEKFNIHQNFSLESFKEQYLNENVQTYVVLDVNSKVVDFISFYELNYKLTENNNNQQYVKVAYLQMYTCLNEPIKSLFDNIIKILILKNYDLFTITDIMNISDVLFCKKINIESKFSKHENEKMYELKFIKGIETKYFHLFNCTSPSVSSEQISLIVPN